MTLDIDIASDNIVKRYLFTAVRLTFLWVAAVNKESADQHCHKEQLWNFSVLQRVRFLSFSLSMLSFEGTQCELLTVSVNKPQINKSIRHVMSCCSKCRASAPAVEGYVMSAHKSCWLQAVILTSWSAVDELIKKIPALTEPCLQKTNPDPDRTQFVYDTF
jgi:hypothetical protein